MSELLSCRLEYGHDISEIVELSGRKCSMNFLLCAEKEITYWSLLTPSVQSIKPVKKICQENIPEQICCTPASGSLSSIMLILQTWQNMLNPVRLSFSKIQRPFHCTSAITTAGFPDLTRGDQGGQASAGVSCTLQRGH